jgi:hypothetical protein
VQYIRLVIRALNIETEVKDLFQALKNVLLSLSYKKQATLRAKALKAVKKLVKINPETINEIEV